MTENPSLPLSLRGELLNFDLCNSLSLHGHCGDTLHLFLGSLCGWLSSCPGSETLLITSKGNTISEKVALLRSVSPLVCVHVRACARMHAENRIAVRTQHAGDN